MDIGKPIRRIEVVPLENPIPVSPDPVPAEPAPEREKVPAGPERETDE